MDLEKIEVRSESWVQDYFTEEEIRAAGAGRHPLAGIDEDMVPQGSSSKGPGHRFEIRLKDINVARLDKSGNAALEFKNEAYACLKAHGEGRITAKVERKIIW